MSLLWDHYWPALVAAAVIGCIAGWLAYGPRVPRRRLPGGNAALAIGGAVALLATGAWHALIAGDGFAAQVEALAAAELKHQEMDLVQARLERAPLTRTLVLSGPADDFQQRELVRIMGAIPGVSAVRWANPPAAVEAGR